MSNTKVIYHANCSDGFCSAWLMSLVYPNAEFIPCQYGSELPEITPNDEVFVLDFSFSREILLNMQKTAKFLLVLDHHKTAQKDLEGLDFCEFDMTRSGARMTYDYLCDKRLLNIDSALDEFVNYIQDRDLWNWKLAYSKEINSAIRSYPMKFGVWNTLPDKNLLQEGLAIERYRRNIIEASKRNAVYVKWANETIPFVECSSTEILSEVVGELAEDYPFGIGWFSLNAGRDGYVFSMRSREGGYDVSEICKRLGGGGHKHAAGCKIKNFTIANDELKVVNHGNK